MGEFRVDPVTGALGAVATGIDLATAPREALDDLRAALDEYLVLYLPGQSLDRFKDMGVEESAPLLQFLCTHMERHDFTCRFRWQAGGVVLWDNRFTLHYPMNDIAGKRRRMIRTTSMESAMGV